MGARHSRRQKSQTTQEEQTEQSQTQHQSLVVATGRGSELVEANMEPSEETASGGELSEVPLPQQEEIGGSSELPSATMHPKCGCYENNNCPVSLASVPSSSSSSSSAPVYGTIGAINNNNSTQQTAAKCGCNCSKPDGINSLETFNGNPSIQAR